MTAHRDVLILIPARMASSRLPGKPLADIAGEPMIVHVMRQALAADIGPVAVATDSEAIAACVEKAGGRAVMTRADHGSGSDRIFEALRSVDPACRAEIIVNLQGDLPTLAPADIAAALLPLADPGVDIATLAAEITDARERANPNVVKVVGSPVAPRAGACRRGPALSPHRDLRLSPRRARPLRQPSRLPARAARKTRAAARARSRHAHRRHRRRRRAARGRHRSRPHARASAHRRAALT
jgi:CTP:molybdopterin cytidylyltransferase MocA